MGQVRSLPTPIRGVSVVESQVHTDHRGAFTRLYCVRELSEIIGSRNVMQCNLSVTVTPGAIRGMHFQRPPHAELKVVRCLRGRVWDVAVDLRVGSPTFRQWHAEELSPQNARALVIPEGCAHGFQALEPNSELLYLHTACYAPEAEGGVRYDDPLLAIMWPLPVSEVSARDQQHPPLSAEFTGIIV